MSDVRKHIVFYGRVQGVGFRYTAKYLAKSLGLTGWVRNDWEGTGDNGSPGTGSSDQQTACRIKRRTFHLY